MKYPKLFEGPSPGGEAALRGLDRNMAPYLSARGEDWIARKSGPFRSVEVASGTPYLWTIWNTPGPFRAAGLGPEDAVQVELSFTKEPFGHTPTTLITSFVVFVGDDYILTYYGDTNDPFNPLTNYWPELLRVDAITPRLPAGDPNGAHKSVDFFDSLSWNGMSDNQHSNAVFASGWKDDDERFMFGASFLNDTGVTAQLANELLQGGTTIAVRQPAMYIGSTKTRIVHEVTLPTNVGRDIDYFTPYCVGRGKLQYLMTVPELITADPPYTLATQVDPKLAYSSDHGETWGVQTATWLLPYIAQADTAWAPRFYNSNRQSTFMSLYCTMQYAGNGKVFTFIPNAVQEGTPTSHADVRQLEFRPYLFLGDAGSVALTRVPWPADDWPTNIGGFTKYDDTNVLYEFGWRRLARLKAAQFSFGEGCLYVPIIRGPHSLETEDTGSTTGWRIMFTHDFGSTWSIATAEPPPAVQNVGLGCPAGTIIKPRLDDSKPGRLIFTGVHPDTGEVEFWQTDGNFEAWKRVWKIRGGEPLPSIDVNGDVLFDSANYVANFGNEVNAPAVFPAFPGEFEKP